MIDVYNMCNHLMNGVNGMLTMLCEKKKYMHNMNDGVYAM